MRKDYFRKQLIIDNGKRGKIALSANNRPLKSLSDIIKGAWSFPSKFIRKRGLFGTFCNCSWSKSKLNQCGLPYEMAIELFQPFIIRELINQGLVI
jgi:DNA-directed RNA polymerase subunit beta'